MMSYHFKNFVFEGGGVKGIAYVGAMEELENRNIIDNIERVGGTSAGAINAILTGLNFSVDEIKSILWNLDFNNFMDDSWGAVRDTKRLIEEFGWYKGDYFRKWISKLVKQKTGNSEATFSYVKGQAGEKGFKDIYLVGTNLSTHFKEVFSYEHTPRMCVADAARISMSIPLFFASKRNVRGDVYVDGGVLSNYPVKLFDREKYVSSASRNTGYYDEENTRLQSEGINISPYIFNEETLGFRLDSAKEIAVFRDQAEPPSDEVEDFFDYVKALIVTYMESQQNLHLHSDAWKRTIYIASLGVGTTQFDLDDQTKNILVESGKAGVNKYFDWYDNHTATNG
jgi:NTE family protein